MPCKDRSAFQLSQKAAQRRISLTPATSQICVLAGIIRSPAQALQNCANHLGKTNTFDADQRASPGTRC